MKLRIRYKRITKVTEIDDGAKDAACISNVREAVPALFGDAVKREFHLSLNNKDILDDTAKIIDDCKMVSGDLIYVICPEVEENLSNPVQSQEKCRSGESTVCQAKASTDITTQTLAPRLSSTKTDNVSSQCHQPCSSSSSMDHNWTKSHDTVAMETDHEEIIDRQIINQCLSEPRLCREALDGAVPAMLREMFKALQPVTDIEVLGVVLHVLMLETGFIVQNQSDNENPGNVPVNWRHPGYLKFNYTYPGCSDKLCCLTVISTGTSVSLHGKVLGSEETTRQCSLRMSAHITGVGTDCASCYKDLAKLSRTFKDSLANPLVQDVRTAAGLEDVFGLLSLVHEVKVRILSCLDLKSLLQVSRVHSQLYNTCKDRYLWRRLYLRDFGNRRDNSLSQDWKQLYKDEFKSRKERRKMLSRMTVITPPLWHPNNPFCGPSNWVPPVPGGIIGGDYDLYPNFPSSLPGVPGRVGPQPPTLPRPRYDLIGPGVNPYPDPALIPRRPSPQGRGGRGGHFGGFGPRFF